MGKHGKLKQAQERTDASVVETYRKPAVFEI